MFQVTAAGKECWRLSVHTSTEMTCQCPKGHFQISYSIHSALSCSISISLSSLSLFLYRFFFMKSLLHYLSFTALHSLLDHFSLLSILNYLTLINSLFYHILFTGCCSWWLFQGRLSYSPWVASTNRLWSRLVGKKGRNIVGVNGTPRGFTLKGKAMPILEWYNK